jgi:hypothetical protein
MMLSMHARLRDRYDRRSLWLDLITLAVSIVLCTSVFLDPRLAARTPLREIGTTLVIGSASTVLFFLSLVALRVDWKEAAGRHSRAVAALAELKAKSRSIMDESRADDAIAQEFFRLYDFTMSTLAAIPERQFAPLKAYHHRKVALSREISRYPSAPVFVLRLRLAIRDSSKAMERSTE